MMKDHLERVVSVDVVCEFLRDQGYVRERPFDRERNHFVRPGGPKVTFASYRGVVTLTEFERVKATTR